MNATRVATIAEVADAAGVSRATVSRVMNGRSTVRADLAERVRAVAAELNYSPSTVARSLSLGRTQTVALLVPDLANPMFQQILRGANQAAARDSYRVLVADSVEDPGRELELALEARRRCDALILCSPRMPDAELAQVLAVAGPVVVVNRDPEDGSVPVLSVDYADGIRTLTERLIKLGHSRFIYLAGPESSASNTVRLRALRALEGEYPHLSIRYEPCGAMIEDGYAALDAVLASRATAVLAYNDLVAFGLLGKLNESGVDVPGDISVVGFDDIAFARYATPSLTTMAVPQSELGRQAWEQLHQLILGGAERPSLYFRPRLVERASSGPVPRERSGPAAEVTGAETSAVPAPPGVLLWSRDDEAGVLGVDGLELARYQRHAALPDVHAPRPFLHPIYTLGGTMVTEQSPVDHRHQYGLSLAVPAVNGTSFWGGRTFVRGAGPTLLENHGTQVPHEMTLTGAALTEHLVWHSHEGEVLIEEDRELTAVTRPEADGWQLSWRSDLRSVRALTIESPATSGRPGAGYGGIFWRFGPGGPTTLLVADGEGEETAHGSTSPWLAVSRATEDGSWTALLVQGATARPWFARAADYLGVGPALAWDTPLTVAEGEDLPLELHALLVDRVLDRDEIEALLPGLPGVH
ncbi:LacI family DNA-binding transcriptional regulator [Occultella glacieicola]|uniref:LacI family DNA-binding transcriptional regulator n=1 Tax=Occultella glacieicola TaxID=2518684 RepID=A0ABY2E1L8_9MICO|nr:DUF6807 family protein [Occultella glacieicola]TDE91679.1 LacI family DNA-binding transcriptional regulator [Occultella glacieicola]